MAGVRTVSRWRNAQAGRARLAAAMTEARPARHRQPSSVYNASYDPPADHLELPPSARYRARDHAAAHTTEYIFSQLIPYLGNKRKLLPLIGQAMAQTGVTGGLFVDFFAGSGVVARFAKRAGFQVVANDWEPYAQVLNHTAIGCNAMPPFAALGGVGSGVCCLELRPPYRGLCGGALVSAFGRAPRPGRGATVFHARQRCKR